MAAQGKHRLTRREQETRRKRRRVGTVAPIIICGAAGILFGLLPNAPAKPQGAARSVTIPSPVPAPPLRFPGRSQPVQPATAVKIYTPHPGESLWSIARDQCGSGTSWKALATANHIGRPWTVPLGKVITVAC